MEAAPKPAKHYLGFLIKLLLTCAAFYIVWRQVNWQEFTAALSTQALEWVFAALCFIFIQLGFGGIRWHQILASLTEHSFSLVKVMRLYFASLVFNVFMPGTLGSDVARIWMARAQNIPTSIMTYSVVTDRIFSLLGLLVLMLASLPFFFEHIGISQDLGIALSLAGLVCGIIGLWLATRYLPRIPRLKPLVPLITIMHHPRKFAFALMSAVAAHVMSCATYYALAMSLSLPISFFDCLVLIPAVMFVTAIPISIGGWGVRELGTTSSLALIGIAAAPSVLISLQVGLLSTLISASGGIIYLLEKRKAH